MPQMSKEEGAFVVEKIFERESYIAAQAAFKQQFNQTQPCKRQSNKTLQNTVYIERVYSGHPLQRTPLYSGHFSRERLKSWSNSYKKTSM